MKLFKCVFFVPCRLQSVVFKNINYLFFYICLFFVCNYNLQAEYINYVQLDENTTDDDYLAITEKIKQQGACKIKEYINIDEKLISLGKVAIDITNFNLIYIKIPSYVQIGTIQSLDKMKIYGENGKSIYLYEYMQNIDKTNNIVYLGLTAIKDNPKSTKCDFAIFDYKAKDNQPAFTVDLSRIIESDKYKGLADAVTGVVLVGTLDGRQPQNSKHKNQSALYVTSETFKKSTMKLPKGFIIAKTAKLIGGMTANSKPAFYIKDTQLIHAVTMTMAKVIDSKTKDKDSNVFATKDATDTATKKEKPKIIDSKEEMKVAKTSNEATKTQVVKSGKKDTNKKVELYSKKKLTKKTATDIPLLTGTIENYGEIIGYDAIKIGRQGMHFPLETASETAKFINHGNIYAKDVAVMVLGIKTHYTETFELTNKNNATIRGKILIDPYADTDILFRVINHGTIIIPFVDMALTASEYIGKNSSQIIVELSGNEISAISDIIEFEHIAKFEANNKITIISDKFNGIITHSNQKEFNLLSAEHIKGDIDNIITIKPHTKNGVYHIIMAEIYRRKQNIRDEIRLKLIGEASIDISDNLPLARVINDKDIAIKQLPEKIALYKKINQVITKESTVTISRIGIKELFYKIENTNILRYALEKSKNYDEFIDYIIPDNSNASFSASARISSKMVDHIDDSLNDSYSFDVVGLKNTGVNSGYIPDIKLNQIINYHKSTEKIQNGYAASKLSAWIYSLGGHVNVYHNIALGSRYAKCNAKTKTYGVTGKTIVGTDNFTTNAISLYASIKANDFYVNLGFLYGFSTHNPVILEKKLDQFKSSMLVFNATCGYMLNFNKFKLDLGSKLGVTNVSINKHDNKFTINHNNQTPKKNSNLLNIDIKTAILSSYEFSNNILIAYKASLGYKFIFAIESKEELLDVTQNDKPDSYYKVKLRDLSQHNVSVNTMINLSIYNHVKVTLLLNYTLQQASQEYGSELTFCYIF